MAVVERICRHRPVGFASAQFPSYLASAQFPSYLTENPQTAASAVGLTVEQMNGMAASMGLGTAWAFAAGNHYQQQIFEDSS
jgi:hypothetical protein